MSEIHQNGARPGGLLRTVVATGEYEANRTGTVAGRDVVWYEASAAKPNATGQLPQQIERYNASVAIDEDGRIWEAKLFVVGVTNGVEVIYRQEYRTHQVGDVSVTRPDWIDTVSV
jgi:hypothetical protein